MTRYEELVQEILDRRAEIDQIQSACAHLGELEHEYVARDYFPWCHERIDCLDCGKTLHQTWGEFPKSDLAEFRASLKRPPPAVPSSPPASGAPESPGST
jgi:hypothetical protein